MSGLLRLLLVLLVGTGPSQAQDATRAEIVFWESVRDSRDPVELEAYLQRYPNGLFARLAEMRLAALGGGKRRAIAAPPLPEVGDNWTYRIRDPHGAKAQRAVSMRIASVSPTVIVEHVSVEGGFTAPRRHAKGGYLIPQGVSVFSPYLPHFEKLVVGAELGYIESTDPGCRSQFVCVAKGRIVGHESVDVPGGRFTVTKVVIQQTWRPAAGTPGNPKELERMNGARTLTVWYSNDAKRAVKYESRLTSGARTPVEADFDLELTSFQVK